MPLESNHCRSVEHHQPSYCCRAPDHGVLSSGSKEVLPLRPSVVPNPVATLSYWDDDAITALRRTYHAPHLLKYTSTLCLSPNPRRMPYAEPCCCTIAPKSRKVAKQIMVDLPAQLPKTQVGLSILDLSQGGRVEVGSGKHHKNGPRGRFGLMFDANPI